MNRNVAETVKTLTEPSGASNILPPKTIVVNQSGRRKSVEFCRGIAQSGSALALGARCRGFKSLYPDQFNGDCSSAGRALDCDSGGRGFEPRQSPHFFKRPVAEFLGLLSCSGNLLVIMLHKPLCARSSTG